jgi:hypothetical protein
MEINWPASPYGAFEDGAGENPRRSDLEEAFEDAFGLSILPDSPRFGRKARYFWLGRNLAGKGVFATYVTDGKQVRIFAARWATPEDDYFYERQMRENL